MVEENFSKGPWRFDGPDPYGDYNILPANEELAIGAVVQNGFRSFAETKANAHLVSAAFDLLAALKHLSAVYEGIYVKMSDGEMELCKAAWAEADVALAKAEGRSDG